MSLREVQALYGLSYSRIRRMIKLPGFPLIEGVVFQQDFDEWRREYYGNASGIILITPVILVWRDYLKFPWLSRTGLRLTAHTLVVAIAVWLIHAETAFSSALCIILIPIFIWGVWSTGLKGATRPLPFHFG